MIDNEQVEEIGDQIVFEILDAGVDFLTVSEVLYDSGIEDDDNNTITKKVYEYVNESLGRLTQLWEDKDAR